eukprot:scaffold222894_cov31-Tisochrysis_lutea.AAC.1
MKVPRSPDPSFFRFGTATSQGGRPSTHCHSPPTLTRVYMAISPVIFSRVGPSRRGLLSEGAVAVAVDDDDDGRGKDVPSDIPREAPEL